MPQRTITLLRSNGYASRFGSHTYNYSDVVVKAEEAEGVAGRRYKVCYKGQRTGRDDKHIVPGSLLYQCVTATAEDLQLLGVVVEVVQVPGSEQPAQYQLEVVPCDPSTPDAPATGSQALAKVKSGPGMRARRAAACLGVPIPEANRLVGMSGILRVHVPEQVYANIQSVLSMVARVKVEEQQQQQQQQQQGLAEMQVDAAAGGMGAGAAAAAAGGAGPEPMPVEHEHIKDDAVKEEQDEGGYDVQGAAVPILKAEACKPEPGDAPALCQTGALGVKAEAGIKTEHASNTLATPCTPAAPVPAPSPAPRQPKRKWGSMQHSQEVARPARMHAAVRAMMMGSQQQQQHEQFEAAAAVGVEPVAVSPGTAGAAASPVSAPPGSTLPTSKSPASAPAAWTTATGAPAAGPAPRPRAGLMEVIDLLDSSDDDDYCVCLG